MKFIITVSTAFLAVVTQGLPYPCPSASTVDVSGSATFPKFATDWYPSGNNFIENHWSEVVKLARPPPYNETVTVQTNCPHNQQGLKNWHDPATWGSAGIPTATAQSVTLPANTKVLISGCSINPADIFPTIYIPAGSELIFGDADIFLQTKGIEVRGALRVGSQTCRMKNKVTITLWGSRGAQQLPASPEVKGISVLGNGILDLFGIRYYPTWSRLATTAWPNDTVVFIQDQVNWQPGQQIVITTTELKDSRDFNRNEVRTITAVAKVPTKNIAAITLDSPLQYRHYGGPEYQAEVGLLSRNVVIQGDSQNSEPTDVSLAICYDTSANFSSFPCSDKYLTGFGGNIMITGNGIGRASGTKLYRMGQTNVLGRYPFHVHLLGQNGKNSFITDSVIQRSFYRCTAVHATHNALISENVAYDVIGHCYYLEDGIEENNTFSYNLGAHIHHLGDTQKVSQNTFGSFGSQELLSVLETSVLTLPADFSASPFYITNAFNTFIGNAASGGWAGFAFPNVQKPLKLSAGLMMCPRDRPLGVFRGNSAHSTAFWWQQAGAIYLGGELGTVTSTDSSLIYWPGRRVQNTRKTCLMDTYNTSFYCATWLNPNASLWMRFEDTKVFLTNGRGMQHWGDRVEITGFECHDCGLSMNVFGAVWVDNMLINCKSDAVLNLTRLQGCNAVNWWQCNVRDNSFFNGFSGFQWYDVFQTHIVTNSIYRNCNNMQRCIQTPCPNSAPWTLLTHSDQFTPDMMQVTKNISYQNVNMNMVLRFSTKLTDKTGVTVSGRLQNWRDEDGSVDGTRRGKTNIGSAWAGSWWKMRNDCRLLNEMWFCPMQTNDFAASFMMWWNRTGLQAQIGDTLCMNGGGQYPCPTVANVTHFGRTEGTDSLLVGVNAKLTGPVIYESGGWFIRFKDGTPKNLTFDTVQIHPNDKLLVAIPYPSTSTFTVIAEAASWCGTWGGNVCRSTFQTTASVDAVLNGAGNLYFFDTAKNLLYLRIVQQVDNSLGDSNVWKQKTITQIPSFTRGGVQLLQRSSTGNYRITIQASNCGAGITCDQPVASVPGQLRPAAAPVLPAPTPATQIISSPVPTYNYIPAGTIPPSLAPTAAPTSDTGKTPNDGVLDTMKNNMPAIIGGGVGGLVVIGAAVLVGIKIRQRKSGSVIFSPSASKKAQPVNTTFAI